MDSARRSGNEKPVIREQVHEEAAPDLKVLNDFLPHLKDTRNFYFQQLSDERCSPLVT